MRNEQVSDTLAGLGLVSLSAGLYLTFSLGVMLTVDGVLLMVAGALLTLSNPKHETKEGEGGDPS